MDFISGNYLKLPRSVMDSYYYRWLMTPPQKIVLQCVWACTVPNIVKGVLLANIKQETLLERVGNGIGLTNLRQILNDLDRLGAVIKVPTKSKNINYAVGIQLPNSNDRFYFLYYLISTYEENVKDYIEKQMYFGQKPGITDITAYIMQPKIKNFIKSNVNNPEFLYKKSSLGRTVVDILTNNTNKIESNILKFDRQNLMV